MKQAQKGDWVQIENTLLHANERAEHLPEDTCACNLKQWVKGIAQQDAEIGEELQITTVTGRIAKGTLCEVNPKYIHDYGEFQPELLQIELQLKEILFGGEK